MASQELAGREQAMIIHQNGSQSARVTFGSSFRSLRNRKKTKPRVRKVASDGDISTNHQPATWLPQARPFRRDTGMFVHDE
jgi:hypothetical protein